VKHLLSFLLATCLVVTLTGCGNIFIRGAINPGTASVSGMVSVVQLSVVIGDGGSMVQVTFVTFLQDGTSSTIGFCGDERSRFRVEESIRANFTPGQSCASIVTIVIT
jgi:hypothetical protein